MTTRRRTSQRGFATMDPDRRRRIARKGGLASHENRRYEEDYNKGYGSEYDDYDDYNEPKGKYENERYEEDFDDYEQQRGTGRRSQPRNIGGRYQVEGYFDDEDFFDDDQSEYDYERPYAYSEGEENYGSRRRSRSRNGFGGAGRRRNSAGSSSFYSDGDSSSYEDRRRRSRPGRSRLSESNRGTSGYSAQRGWSGSGQQSQQRRSGNGGWSSGSRRRSWS